MKNICIAVLVFASLNVFPQEAKLTLASDVWPPFTNTKGERSISNDIVREALSRMDISTDFIITDFDSVLSGINDGTYNGSAALWKSKEREEKLVFSNAYLQNQLILVGRKGSNPNKASLSELKGKRIGLVKGYAYDETLQSENSFDILYGENDQENLERLLSGEIDFMIVDNLLLQYVLVYEVNDINSLLEFASVPLIPKPLYFAIRKDTPNAEKIITGFNNEIKEMIADGTYNKILELNWIRADIDGDGTLELIFTGNEVGVKPPEIVYDIINTESSDTINDYYINGQLYASWDDVPEDYKVAQKVTIPAVDIPNDGKIRF